MGPGEELVPGGEFVLGGMDPGHYIGEHTWSASHLHSVASLRVPYQPWQGMLGALMDMAGCASSCKWPAERRLP